MKIKNPAITMVEAPHRMAVGAEHMAYQILLFGVFFSNVTWGVNGYSTSIPKACCSTVEPKEISLIDLKKEIDYYNIRWDHLAGRIVEIAASAEPQDKAVSIGLTVSSAETCVMLCGSHFANRWIWRESRFPKLLVPRPDGTILFLIESMTPAQFEGELATVNALWDVALKNKNRVSISAKTVFDPQTGLLWKCAVEGEFTHEEAMAQFGNVSVGTAWRIPSIIELESLLKASPVVVEELAQPYETFWSSTGQNGNAMIAKMVEFGSECVSSNSTNNTYFVRLVRDEFAVSTIEPGQAKKRLLEVVPTARLAAHVLSLSVFGNGDLLKDKASYLAYMQGCPEAQDALNRAQSITYTKSCAGKHGGRVTEQRTLLQDLMDWSRDGLLLRLYGQAAYQFMYTTNM
jgi:hypothetical protein